MGTANGSGTRQDVATAVRVGVKVATVATLVALASAIMTDGKSIEQYGVSLFTIVGIYYFGFIAAGVVVGLLRPLRRSLLGAMLLGVVATLPGAFAVWLSLAMAHPNSDIHLDVILLATAISSCMAGPLYGAIGWFTRERHGR